MVAGNIKDVSILKNALMESGINNAVFYFRQGLLLASQFGPA